MFGRTPRRASAAAAEYARANGYGYARDNRDGLLPDPETILPGRPGTRWSDVVTCPIGSSGQVPLIAVNGTWHGAGSPARRHVTVVAVPDAVPAATCRTRTPAPEPFLPAGGPAPLPPDLAGAYDATGHPAADRLFAGPVLALLRTRPDLSWSTAQPGYLVVWDDGSRPFTDMTARLALARAVLFAALPGAYRTQP